MWGRAPSPVQAARVYRAAEPVADEMRQGLAPEPSPAISPARVNVSPLSSHSLAGCSGELDKVRTALKGCPDGWIVDLRWVGEEGTRRIHVPDWERQEADRMPLSAVENCFRRPQRDEVALRSCVIGSCQDQQGLVAIGVQVSGRLVPVDDNLTVDPEIPVGVPAPRGIYERSGDK